MAQRTTYTPTPSQWASAACHYERRSEWRTVRIAGVRYVALTSGTSGKVYLVRADARGCACPAYQHGYPMCAHQLALELSVLADDLGATCQAPNCTNDVAPGATDGSCHKHTLIPAFG